MAAASKLKSEQLSWRGFLDVKRILNEYTSFPIREDNWKEQNGSVMSHVAKQIPQLQENWKSGLWKAVNKLEAAGLQVAYASIFRQCGYAKALELGMQIHRHVIENGHERDIYLGNLIIQMYCKCESLESARRVFTNLHQRNVYSWTIMIGTYAEHGMIKDAIQLFSQMQVDGVMANNVTFVCILSACASQAALAEGGRVHACVAYFGLESDAAVGNALINMYAKCGCLDVAKRTFDTFPKWHVVLWNAMIGAYAHHGYGREAMQLFSEMQQDCVMPDKLTYLSVISACGTEASLEEGKYVHAHVMDCAAEGDIMLGTGLVNMYGKCGMLDDSRRVFDNMLQHDVFSWTAMITAYAQLGYGKEALLLFQQVHLTGIIPNKVTYVSVFDACCNQEALNAGKQMHSCIAGSGLETDVVVGNALLKMYGRCSSLQDACGWFENMLLQDVVSWTTMIAVYCLHHCNRKAIQLFENMLLGSVVPTMVTFLSILDACASPDFLAVGKWVHAQLAGSGFEPDVTVGNALIHMYGKCECLNVSWTIFQRMADPDVVSWTAMITACAHCGHWSEGLQLFQQMQVEGTIPDKVTYVSLVDICTCQASLAEGKRLQVCIIGSGNDSDIFVENSLVNLYGKCGSLEDAKEMFETMHKRNVVSWNSMIVTYALHGRGKEALELYHKMHLERIIPDNITFLSLLFACSHTGLVEEGWQCFASMIQNHGIRLSVEHYNCIVDLLGRAGQIVEGGVLLENMPLEATAASWMALLSACRMHFDVDQGTEIAEHVFNLDRENAAPYILLKDIYAAAASWDDAAKVKELLKNKDLIRQGECISVSVKDNMYNFFLKMNRPHGRQAIDSQNMSW